MKRLEFIEIDLDYCSLRYAEGACAAPAGESKCYNTKATCKARPSFQMETVTLRFAKGASYLAESGIDYVASCIENVNFSPATVSLGENLGTRASLSVQMSDFPFADTGMGFDKYVQERPYDPFKVGTFWGKFRARHPYIRGRAIRWIQGELGQPIEQMETRHFVMDSFESPSLDGRFSIVAKDALKLVDDDRAKAPVASRGFIVSDIDENATTVTLGPAGIGDIEYPASGWVNIAGKEICTFTRVGDTLTLVRGVEGTIPTEHKAQDRVQVCLRYNGADPADIIRDLFVTYAKVPPEYISLVNWKDETGLFLRRLYSRVIAEPTGVSKLVSDLIHQAGLMVWWDDSTARLQLRVMRKISTDAQVFDDNNILQGTLRVKEQPNSRLSQVMTYFGKRTPLERDTEPTSYHSMQLNVNLEAEDDYGDSLIKTIHSSWIPQFGRPVAQRLNEIQLGRFVDPPRLFNFSTFLDGNQLPPVLGEGYRLFARPMQNAAGYQDGIPIQVTRLLPRASGYDVTAAEMRFVDFNEEDLDSRIIIIDSNYLNFNWRNAYDQLYPPPTPDDDIICIVAAGVIVGSRATDLPAFDVGVWPTEINLNLQILGRIQGRGGDGGAGASGRLSNGQDGGLALYARRPIDITASNQIWGGGGGGGGGTGSRGGGGGGGQGFLGGVAGADAGSQSGVQDGTSEMPGRSFWPNEGNGGAAGQPGQKRGISGSGGAAGRAIDGNSFLTFTNGQGDIRGPRVN